MYKEKLLRETKSLCPICNGIVNAKVLEQNGKIFLSKYCSAHGRVDVPLASSTFYRGLEEFYFPFRDKRYNRSVERTELVVTFKCNMNCPICYLGDFKRQLYDFEPTLQEIEDFIKTTKYHVFVISGGEPTCREDLNEIIKILKKYKKTVIINTNGLKLASLDYVWQLKRAGIDRVNIQFAGFDSGAEEYLRGKDYISVKLKAIDNLRKMDISTGINALIAGDLNENQIIKLIDYAVANDFIRMVNLTTMIFVGYTKGYPKERYLMPDDILRILEEQTAGKIKRQNVFLFKKLEITISSFFNRDTCFYHQTYLIVRNRNSYEPIDKYINLKGIESYLDKYQRIGLRNKTIAKIYLLTVVPLILILYSKFFMIAKDLFCTIISYFFKRRHFLKTRKFIYLLFSVECDAYRIDYTINKSCPCKSIFFFDKVNGHFVKRKKAIESTYWLLWEENK